MEERTLYVGGDDSNHAGNTKGEFIVATFSRLYKDSIVKKHPNRRDHYAAQSWLQNSERDYRFTICTSEHLCGGKNLPLVLPSLIDRYIWENDLIITQINAYLDGKLSECSEEKMREDLKKIRGVERVVVDNFMKKRKSEGKIIKGYYCPKLVWVADTIANSLYRYSGPIADLFKDKKMVRTRF